MADYHENKYKYSSKEHEIINNKQSDINYLKESDDKFKEEILATDKFLTDSEKPIIKISIEKSNFNYRKAIEAIRKGDEVACNMFRLQDPFCFMTDEEFEDFKSEIHEDLIDEYIALMEDDKRMIQEKQKSNK